MSRARIQLVPAWILKTTPYRDSSLLVEALTRDHGRVGLVARGARSGKSKLRERLQCFRPLLMSWVEAGDLGTLTHAEPDGVAVNLVGERIFSGWYLNELLLRLLQRHDRHEAVFEHYAQTLPALLHQGEAALRYFELTLLAETGFGLDLPEDLEPERWYHYLPSGVPEPLRQEEAGAYPGRCLIGLRDRMLQGDADLRFARNLLRSALAVQLGDKALASASVLRSLRLQARRKPGQD